MATLTLRENDVRQMMRSLDKMGKEIGRKSTRRKISNIAAVPVQWDMRVIARREFRKRERDAIHYYYRNKKKISTIHAGHTEQAIQVMTRKRNKIPKATSAVVGPLKTDKAGQGGVFGKSKAQNPTNVDAYYAQMIFGSARAFGERIAQRALRSALPLAVRIYDREVGKEIDKQARRTGWR